MRLNSKGLPLLSLDSPIWPDVFSMTFQVVKFRREATFLLHIPAPGSKVRRCPFCSVRQGHRAQGRAGGRAASETDGSVLHTGVVRAVMPGQPLTRCFFRLNGGPASSCWCWPVNFPQDFHREPFLAPGFCGSRGNQGKTAGGPSLLRTLP